MGMEHGTAGTSELPAGESLECSLFGGTATQVYRNCAYVASQRSSSDPPMLRGS